MSSFSGRSKVRRVPLWGRYEVGDDGVVYSGGFPLKAIAGVGVNLGGRRERVADLVAGAFLPREEGKPWVRHRNGDVRDNRVENLEWSAEREETRGRRSADRWVEAWTVEGEVVGLWRGVKKASEGTGVGEEAIRNALRGRQRTAGGLLWRELSR